MQAQRNLHWLLLQVESLLTIEICLILQLLMRKQSTNTARKNYLNHALQAEQFPHETTQKEQWQSAGQQLWIQPQLGHEYPANDQRCFLCFQILFDSANWPLSSNGVDIYLQIT